MPLLAIRVDRRLLVTGDRRRRPLVSRRRSEVARPDEHQVRRRAQQRHEIPIGARVAADPRRVGAVADAQRRDTVDRRHEIDDDIRARPFRKLERTAVGPFGRQRHSPAGSAEHLERGDGHGALRPRSRECWSAPHRACAGNVAPSPVSSGTRRRRRREAAGAGARLRRHCTSPRGWRRCADRLGAGPAPGHPTCREVLVEHDEVGMMLARELQRQAALHRRQEVDLRPHREHLLHQTDGREVVLDIEDGALKREHGDRDQLLATDARLRRRRRSRELDPEGAAHAGLALDTDAAVHPLDELAREREPEPGSRHRRALGAEPLERLEEPGFLLRSEAGPGVAHREPDPFAQRPAGSVRQVRPVDAGLARRLHVDVGAIAGVLDRVGEQVQQRLHQSLPVRKHVGIRAVAEDPAHLVVVAERRRRHEAHALLDDRLERDGLERERLAARLDPCDVEDVVDEAEQMAARLLHR